jgi:glycosyltransferase involved in cell wall biosynthesis
VGDGAPSSIPLPSSRIETRGRILAVLPDHPHPADMGSRVRNLRILEALSERFDLDIVTLVHDRRHLEDPGPITRLGRWIPVLAPHRRSQARRLLTHGRAYWAALREGLHRDTFFQSFPELSQKVDDSVRAGRYDLVHSAYWFTLRHLESMPRPPLWIVDTHDVQFERHERLWGRRSPREKAAELHELRRYDRVIAITERDRALFRSSLGESPLCEVIGMGLDFSQWDDVAPAQPPAPRVAFYGNLSTSANQQAARHLLDDLVPSLAREVKGLEVLLLGADPPEDLRAPKARPGVHVEVTGFVDDVKPWLASARVIALTLRAGSGQRGRVVEALALGVPVIGYPEALEGLELSEGEGIVVARDAAEMGRQLSALLLDPQRAQALGAVGKTAVRERYGIERTYGLFPALYETLIANQNARATAAPSPHGSSSR